MAFDPFNMPRGGIPTTEFQTVYGQSDYSLLEDKSLAGRKSSTVMVGEGPTRSYQNIYALPQATQDIIATGQVGAQLISSSLIANSKGPLSPNSPVNQEPAIGGGGGGARGDTSAPFWTPQKALVVGGLMGYYIGRRRGCPK